SNLKASRRPLDRNVVRQAACTATLRLSGTAVSTARIAEEDLEGDHIVLAIELKDSPTSSNPLSTIALVDTGATGYAFVDKRYARDRNLPLYKLKKQRVIACIDGRPID